MYTLVYCCAVLTNTVDQPDITGKYGDIIVHIYTDGRQASQKSRINGWMRFYTYGKDHNKKPLFYGFPSTIETTRVIQRKKDSNIFVPKTNPLSNG